MPGERERKYNEHDPSRIWIDFSDPRWASVFAEAPIYEKCVQVRARAAIPGEPITTRLKGGVIEREGVIARENQVVVTNPRGEEQLVDYEKFTMRYTPSEIPGVYDPIGMIRVFDNPLGRPVGTMLQDGRPQHQEADCLFASIYDPKKPNEISQDCYFIGREEFEESYRPHFTAGQFDRPLGGTALEMRPEFGL